MKIRNLLSDRGFWIFILFSLISLITRVCLFTGLIAKNNENKRLQSNIEMLTSEVKHFETTDRKNAAQVKTLTLTVSELKEQNIQLATELKTMNVKLRDAKNIQQISTQAQYEIQLIKKDSIIFDTVQVATYKYADDWISFEAICPTIGDTCTAKIATQDSILIVQHSKTKKFLWWTWKKYSGQTTVKNYNPYSEIRSIRNIDIEK